MFIAHNEPLEVRRNSMLKRFHIRAEREGKNVRVSDDVNVSMWTMFWYSMVVLMVRYLHLSMAAVVTDTLVSHNCRGFNNSFIARLLNRYDNFCLQEHWLCNKQLSEQSCTYDDCICCCIRVWSLMIARYLEVDLIHSLTNHNNIWQCLSLIIAIKYSASEMTYYCVGWGVKFYSLTPNISRRTNFRLFASHRHQPMPLLEITLANVNQTCKKYRPITFQFNLNDAFLVHTIFGKRYNENCFIYMWKIHGGP